MSTSPAYRLVLHPDDIYFSLSEWQPIVEALQDVQFIGDPLVGQNGRRYLAGEHFLNFITFMGCSPYIAFEPPPDGSEDFCHLRFSNIYTHPEFRCASRNVFARCPRCGKRIQQWEAAITQWRENPASSVMHCDKCNAGISLYELGWRHGAGFARMFIDIYSIYPQEGIPTEPLLDLLEKVCGVRWGYFYTDN